MYGRGQPQLTCPTGMLYVKIVVGKVCLEFGTSTECLICPFALQRTFLTEIVRALKDVSITACNMVFSPLCVVCVVCACVSRVHVCMCVVCACVHVCRVCMCVCVVHYVIV